MARQRPHRLSLACTIILAALSLPGLASSQPAPSDSSRQQQGEPLPPQPGTPAWEEQQRERLRRELERRQELGEPMIGRRLSPEEVAQREAEERSDAIRTGLLYAALVGGLALIALSPALVALYRRSSARWPIASGNVASLALGWFGFAERYPELRVLGVLAWFGMLAWAAIWPRRSAQVAPPRSAAPHRGQEAAEDAEADRAQASGQAGSK